jgi:hypothetical protein
LSLVVLLVVVIVACIGVWLAQTYAPPPFKMVLVIAICVIFCLWLLGYAGVLGGGPYLRVR